MLKLVWPTAVGIVPSVVMNYMNAHLPRGGEHCLQRDGPFVCHLMGESDEARRRGLDEALQARRAQLARLLAMRNATYVVYVAWPARP